MESRLLDIRNLETQITTGRGLLKPVDGVSFAIDRGETVCIVGESGCGKSLTALSILRLIHEPIRTVGGQIFFDGNNLLELSEPQMRKVLGNRIGVVFQEPMSALNPVLKIGEQIMEPLLRHRGLPPAQAWNRAAELIRRMNIAQPERIMQSYPHQLSGGMKQRILLAMALSCDPLLLVADEPTTALDVTLQAEILDLLRQFKEQQGMSILLITHDLGVVAEIADRVIVMYAGKVVEQASVFELFRNPQHPYTQGLMKSRPSYRHRRERLYTIPGEVPDLTTAWTSVPSGCRFADRCEHRLQVCFTETPPKMETAPGHEAACWLYDRAAERSGREQNSTSA